MGVFGVIGAVALVLMKDKKLNLANDDKNVRGWVWYTSGVEWNKWKDVFLFLYKFTQKIKGTTSKGLTGWLRMVASTISNQHRVICDDSFNMWYEQVTYFIFICKINIFNHLFRYTRVHANHTYICIYFVYKKYYAKKNANLSFYHLKN